jgi:hypothetical protein
MLSLRPPRIDAQALYPATSCIFVAKWAFPLYFPASLLTRSSLEQNASDQQLEFELTKILNQYGSVFVKIRRDKRRDKRMPYAFGQFTVGKPSCSSQIPLLTMSRRMSTLVLLCSMPTVSLSSGAPCASNRLEPTVSFFIHLIARCILTSRSRLSRLQAVSQGHLSQ